MMSWMAGIEAVDEHLDAVMSCATSIELAYGVDAPIALLTNGGPCVPKQSKVAALAKKRAYRYMDVPRQDFLPPVDELEWHCCESLNRVMETQAFAELGCRELYTMHSDVVVYRDFRPEFHGCMTGKWSFVSMLRPRQTGMIERTADTDLWDVQHLGGRLTTCLTIYNPDFVDELYQTYGDEEGIWNGHMKQWPMWGDVAQFGVAREWHGFTGRGVPSADGFCNNAVAHVCGSSMRRPAFFPERFKRGVTLAELEECRRKRCPPAE